MKKVGITGAPVVGKTTLWRAITGGETSGDIATVPVPEPRLDKLVELHASKSRVPAQVEVVDVHAGARTQAAALARLREMDALLIVLPSFGGQDPKQHMADINDELLLADMGPIETRLQRAAKDPVAKKEIPTLEAAMEHLSSGLFLAEREWEQADMAVFAPLAPITLKPCIYLDNVDEEGLSQHSSQEGHFLVNASLEAEVAGLDVDEAKGLLAMYGVEEPVLGKLVMGLYRSLDLITFFTTSEKESRAWEIKRGSTAPEAAGAIHSDLQRGFIRAEVVHYDELIAAGTWDAAKSKGLLRVEGKDYVFKEGDVTHFRFAV